MATYTPRRSERLSALSGNPRKRKSPAAGTGTGTGEGEAVPTTPLKRRPNPSEPSPPPATPTPCAVGLIAGRSGPAGPSSPRSKAIARLVNPQATNAPLLSPETSRVVASRSLDTGSSSEASSSSTSAPPAGITTATLLEEACRHLVAVDPRMRALVDQHHCHMFSPEGLAQEIDPFESLTSGIISQQISGSAAKAIKGRFVALFRSDGEGAGIGSGSTPRDDGPRFPSPSQVAGTSVERLRMAGLSQRKVE